MTGPRDTRLVDTLNECREQLAQSKRREEELERQWYEHRCEHATLFRELKQERDQLRTFLQALGIPIRQSIDESIKAKQAPAQITPDCDRIPKDETRDIR